MPTKEGEDKGDLDTMGKYIGIFICGAFFCIIAAGLMMIIFAGVMLVISGYWEVVMGCLLCLLFSAWKIFHAYRYPTYIALT